MKSERFIATKTELAARAGVSIPTINRWQGRPGFPVRGKNGWNAIAFDAFAKTALGEAAKKQTGENADLKRAKLQKQVELLDVTISAAKREEAKAAGELLPVEEHLSELRTFACIARDVFSQWISEVKVLTGDARVVSEAERLRDKALERMREKIRHE